MIGMKNKCTKTIATDKGEITVNLCRMIGKCENKDCRCEKAKKFDKKNEKIELKA